MILGLPTNTSKYVFVTSDIFRIFLLRNRRKFCRIFKIIPTLNPFNKINILHLNPSVNFNSFDENSTYLHIGNLKHLEMNWMFISICYRKDWFPSYRKITNAHYAFLGTIEKQIEFCNNGGYRTELGLRMEKEIKREKIQEAETIFAEANLRQNTLNDINARAQVGR